MNSQTALSMLLAVGASYGFGETQAYPLKPVIGSNVDGYCKCETPNVNRRNNCRRCYKRVSVR